jgi:hypothetical protein
MAHQHAEPAGDGRAAGSHVSAAQSLGQEAFFKGAGETVLDYLYIIML